MNFCDKMFRFPYRVYEDPPSPVLEDTINIKDRKWILGDKYIYINDIISIADSFYLDTDIDDVIKTGFNASLIFTKDEFYSCEWPIDILKKRLNEHSEKIEKNKDRIEVK